MDLKKKKIITKKIPTECYTQTHKPQIQSEALKK
jgi:hypothetical protein